MAGVLEKLPMSFKTVHTENEFYNCLAHLGRLRVESLNLWGRHVEVRETERGADGIAVVRVEEQCHATSAEVAIAIVGAWIAAQFISNRC